MNKQELAWLDEQGVSYRISVTKAAGYLIQAGDNSIAIPNRAAFQSLSDALSEFHGSPLIPELRKTASASPRSRQQTLDPDFPKKVRNAIFIINKKNPA